MSLGTEGKYECTFYHYRFLRLHILLDLKVFLMTSCQEASFHRL